MAGRSVPLGSGGPALLAFHVTTKQAWQRVAQDGLEPRIGDRSAQAGERFPAVYLFGERDAALQALMGWLGDAFDEEQELVLLTLDASGLNLESDESCSWELRSVDLIPAAQILSVEMV